MLNISKQAKKKRRAQGRARAAKQRLKKKAQKAPAKTKKRDLSRVLPIGAKLTDILKSGVLIQGCRKIVQYEDENLSWRFYLMEGVYFYIYPTPVNCTQGKFGWGVASQLPALDCRFLECLKRFPFLADCLFFALGANI